MVQGLSRDFGTCQKRSKEPLKLRLVPMAEYRRCEVFLPTQCGCECPTVGLTPANKTRFINRAFLQQSIQKNMYRTVFPGFFLTSQQVRPGQGGIQ